MSGFKHVIFVNLAMISYFIRWKYCSLRISLSILIFCWCKNKLIFHLLHDIELTVLELCFFSCVFGSAVFPDVIVNSVMGINCSVVKVKKHRKWEPHVKINS